MGLYRRLLILLAFICFYGYSFSQGIVWQEATEICGASSGTEFTYRLPSIEEYSDHPDYIKAIEECGNYFSFNLNNPHWFRIVATSGTINFDLSTSMCEGTGHGVGVQVAIVEVIGGEPVAAYCNSDPNEGSNIEIDVTGFTPNSTYYLVFDGFAESVCSYTISDISGFDNPSITDPISSVYLNGNTDSGSACLINQELSITVVNGAGDPIENASVYNWSLSNFGGPEVINTMTNSNILVIERLPPGRYEFSVQPGNSCLDGQVLSGDFWLDPNPIQIIDEPPVCLDVLSDAYTPTDPLYQGPDLTGLPQNPTRDTFFVDRPGGGFCPTVQVIPLEFINGSDVVVDNIDATVCSLTDSIEVYGQKFGARARGSTPYYVSSAGACGNTIELTVSLLFLDGFIREEKCFSGSSTLYFEHFNPAYFSDVEEFASYRWLNENGDEVSTDPTFEATSSGEYSLDISMTIGANPPCTFTIPAYEVNLGGISELDIGCTDQTSESITFRWNAIDDIETYIVSVNGRVEAETTDERYEVNGLTAGERVKFDVFAIGNNSNCLPLQDSITCEAMSCPDLNFLIENSYNTTNEISVCKDGTVLPEIRLSLNTTLGAGRGRWRKTGGGMFEGDESDAEIVFNPNNNPEGDYLITFLYDEADCEYRSENDIRIEIIEPPISTTLVREDGRRLTDGICLGETLTLEYTGNPGSNATAVWGGTHLGDATITGDLADRTFDITFNSVGQKELTFMIMDDNGCNSATAPYNFEVGEPLMDQDIICDSPQNGIRFDWPDEPNQACFEEYRIYIDGNRQQDITVSEYTYTRAAIGREYEVEVVAVSSCGCGTQSFNIIRCVYEPDQVCEDVTIELDLVAGDTLICLGGGVASVGELDVILSGEDPTGVAMWEVDTGNASISPDGNFDPNVAGVGTHQVKYIWTEGDCSYQDSVSFIVTDPSTVSFDMEAIDPMCFGEDFGVLNVMVSGIEPDFGVYIDDDAIGSKDTTFMLDSGMHFVSVIDSLTGCDTLAEINIAEGPDSLFLFPADEYFSRGEDNLTVTLDSAYATTIDSLFWTFNGEPICTDLGCGEIFVFEPDTSGILCFEGYYSGMCVYTECATVTYFPEFKPYYPNIISLASDELPENQTFQVYFNDPNARVQKLYIYDRWGNSVYQNSTEGSNMSWDPRDKNCSQGVYAFYLEIMQSDGKPVSHSGTITVVE